MLIELRWFSCCEDVFGLGNFSLSSVRYEQILVHLDRGFVSQYAVFGDANAVDWSLFNIRFITAVPLVVLFVVFIICQRAPTCS